MLWRYLGPLLVNGNLANWGNGDVSVLMRSRNRAYTSFPMCKDHPINHRNKLPWFPDSTMCDLRFCIGVGRIQALKRQEGQRQAAIPAKVAF